MIEIIVVDTPAAHTGPHDTTHDGAQTSWPNVPPSDFLSACRAEQLRVCYNHPHTLRITVDPRRCGAHRPLVRQHKYATYRLIAFQVRVLLARSRGEYSNFLHPRPKLPREALNTIMRHISQVCYTHLNMKVFQNHKQTLRHDVTKPQSSRYIISGDHKGSL
jgi:hypothetical protein